ncbi:MAG TPA: hypothetical protein VK112_02285 [Fodinibius sp.]|nr:hypothetical protein [Fodinibius sp.]
MKKQINVFLCAIVVIMIGCDAQDESVSKTEAQKAYVQLAKEFEDKFLYKNYIISKSQNSSDSLLLNKEQLKEIKAKNGFNNHKIEAFRDSIYSIAQQYGVPREDVTLNEYFYINHRSGEIRSTDYFNKMFAYTKYKKEQAKELQSGLNKLKKAYLPKIKQAKDSAKVQKLIEEYRKKKEEIKNSSR